MQFEKIALNPEPKQIHDQIEEVVNTLVRGYDTLMGTLGLGGRKGDYDDVNYEFNGGAKDELRKKHYDKSLRLLWKAEGNTPWLSFRDCTSEELALLSMAEKSLNRDELRELKRVRSEDFRRQIQEEYTQAERQAIVNVLSTIGHGEAYAWMVSTELLNEVKSTGARSALTMQVLEEAKHFVVLRELIQAFDCPIPRLTVWEYVLLEQGFKSKGLEKFFAMNVLVEGFALSIFGMLSTLPGLEILRLFHLDESRHTGLPANYFKEFPMSEWEKRNPISQVRRLGLILPVLPLMTALESDLAELGIDTFEFVGSTARKILNLMDRVGFTLPIDNATFATILNGAFNAYTSVSRVDYEEKDFLVAETTKGKAELEVEAEVFRLREAAAAAALAAAQNGGGRRNVRPAA